MLINKKTTPPNGGPRLKLRSRSRKLVQLKVRNPRSSHQERLTCALELAAQGKPVFPVGEDKKPLTKHGFRDATTDQEIIRTWWSKWLDALPGVPTGSASGIFVLDVDRKGDVDGFATLKRQGWDIPPTRYHATPNGGLHYLFRHKNGIPFPSTTGKLGLGLDTRGEGGYIVWWPAAGFPVGSENELASPPAWLLTEFNQALGRLHSKSSAAEKIQEGGRNDALSRIAYGLRKQGLGPDAIYAALLKENERLCEPPLEAREVRQIVDGKTGIEPDENAELTSRLDAEVARLAKLSPLVYERARVDAAKRLGIRQRMLDAQVKQARAASMPQDQQGGAIEIENPEPWPEPVDGTALLDEIEITIGTYIVLPEHAQHAIALWIIHTYAYDCARVTPILAITSPTKGCGKTTLLTLLKALVSRPLAASNISPAAVFRTIEAVKPTLLIDEADSFLKDNDGLRGVLNSGHSRGTAKVVRLVGDEHEPRQFSTWAPKAIAKIGKLPETLHDRSIAITLQRKPSGAAVSRMPVDLDCTELRRKCVRWAADHAEQLRAAPPVALAALQNRAADNWEPLLAIADEAGGHRPQRAREAALKLCGTGTEPDSDEVKELLLSDIREIFSKCGCNRLPSARLCSALAELEEHPWDEFIRGKPISQRQLAHILAGFGISSGTIRMGEVIAKGYRRDQFDDAFARYLPDPSVTASQSSTGAGSPKIRIRNRENV